MKLKSTSFCLSAAIFCFCLVISTIGFSQSNKMPVIITGILSDEFRNEETPIVEFNCYDQVSFGKTISFQHHQTTVSEGKFHLEIIPKHDHFYMEVALYAEETDILYNTYGKGRFLVRAGDTLCISLDKDAVRFSGQTSSRMACQSEIFDITYHFPAIARDAYADKARLFALRKAALDETEKEKLSVLNKNKHLFSEVEYRQISGDITSMKNRSLLNSMNNALYREPDLSAQLTDFFNANFPPLPTDARASTTECVGYFPDFVYFREMVNARLSYPHATTADLTETIWENVNRSYQGNLRERIWIDLFLRMGNSAPYAVKEQLYRKSKAIMQSTAYREALETWASNQLARSEVIGFSLETTKGTFLTPDSLRGKVVVMDFWFNGCYPCMVLAKNMEPIIARYAADSRVVFLSINVDKHKERWVSAVASGKYVSPGQINTFTNGLGKYHPLVTYYKIIGFPKIMILDRDGRVYDEPIPVPVSAETNEEFVRLIEELKGM